MLKLVSAHLLRNVLLRWNALLWWPDIPPHPWSPCSIPISRFHVASTSPFQLIVYLLALIVDCTADQSFLSPAAAGHHHPPWCRLYCLSVALLSSWSVLQVTSKQLPRWAAGQWAATVIVLNSLPCHLPVSRTLFSSSNWLEFPWRHSSLTSRWGADYSPVGCGIASLLNIIRLHCRRSNPPSLFQCSPSPINAPTWSCYHPHRLLLYDDISAIGSLSDQLMQMLVF